MGCDPNMGRDGAKDGLQGDPSDLRTMLVVQKPDKIQPSFLYSVYVL